MLLTSLVVWGMAEGASAETESLGEVPLDGIELRRQLVEHRFDELSASIAGLLQGDDSAAHSALRRLAEAPTSAAPHFDSWIEWSHGGSPGPASPEASLARAAHRLTGARQASGEVMKRVLHHGAADVQAALERLPDSRVAHALAIELATPLGDREAIERHVKQGLAAEPASYVVRRAQVLSLAPRWGGSLSRMKTAARAGQKPELLARAPELAWLEGLTDYDRGRVSAGRGARTRAVVLFGQALEHGPNPEVLAARAHAYLSDERWAHALEDADSALASRPGMKAPLLDRAVALVELGRTEEGLAALSSVTELDPMHTDAARWRQRWASGHLRDASRHYAARDLDAAVHAYDEALALTPDDARAHHGRALALEGLGRLDEAIASLERSLESDPRAEATYRSLDRLLSQRGEWTKLAKIWSQLIRLEPKNAEAYVERAGAQLARGRRRAAVQDAERACGMGEPRGCAFLKKL